MDLLLTDFHLLRPLWLLVIIPAFILIILMKQQHKKQGQWHQVFPTHLANLLIENKPSATHKTSMTALIITSIIIAISLSGPTWERIEQPLFKIKKAQVVIADMSLSMYSTDILPNRLTRAKFKINDLVSRLGEGDTALLAYAGDAFVISPMTQDVANLKNLIPALNPQIMPVYGSAPSYAIEKALELFGQANHQSGDIYLITDGMDAADAREITQLLKNTQFTLNIMGVGTPQGAPIKLPNDQLLKDDDGNIVIPRLQSSTLRALSKTLSGRYSNLTNDTSDIDYLVSADSTGELSDEQQDNQFGDEWHEMGPYLILFLLPFAALAFRRGIIISCVMVLMLNPMATSPLMAAEIIAPATNQELALPNNTLSPDASLEATSLDTSPVDSWWDNLWQTKNQQALASFNDNNFEEAAAQFENDQWRGASQYKQGNFEQALEHFNKGKSSQDIFNQANTLSQMQQFDQAIKRYESLLKQKPDFPNARENLEIVKQLAKQKKEQQKQDGDQSGEQSDSDEQKNDGQQSDSDEQQQSDNKDNEQQNSDQQPQDSSDQQQSSQSQSQSDENSEQKDGEESDSTNDSENNQQGEGEEKPEPTDEEKEELAKQQQAAKESQQLFNNENLSKDELQRLNQLVKKIPDNPSLLLEAKMAQEARKRKQTRMVTKERKQW